MHRITAFVKPGMTRRWNNRETGRAVGGIFLFVLPLWGRDPISRLPRGGRTGGRTGSHAAPVSRANENYLVEIALIVLLGTLIR